MADYFKAVVPKSSLPAKATESLPPAEVMSADDACQIAMKLNDDLQPKKAIEMLKRAVELDPVHPIAVPELGSTLRDIGRAEEAIEVFEAALQTDPKIAEIRLEYGNNLLRMGKLKEAARQYTQCMEDRPNWDAPHSQLIMALTRMGKTEEARRVLQDLGRFNPDQRTVEMLEKLISSAE